MAVRFGSLILMGFELGIFEYSPDLQIFWPAIWAIRDREETALAQKADYEDRTIEWFLYKQQVYMLFSIDIV